MREKHAGQADPGPAPRLHLSCTDMRESVSPHSLFRNEGTEDQSCESARDQLIGSDCQKAQEDAQSVFVLTGHTFSQQVNDPGGTGPGLTCSQSTCFQTFLDPGVIISPVSSADTLVQKSPAAVCLGLFSLDTQTR